MGGWIVTASTKPLYLCLHVPEFPAQARLRSRSEQRQRAVVILEGVSPLQQVCSATRKAVRDGVAKGMTLAELDAFGDVVVLTRSVEEERSARAALVELADNFTPRMQMLSDDPLVCTLVLDITGTRAVFGSTAQLVIRVRQAMERLGLYATYAVSHNFYTSVCVAPNAARGCIVIEQGKEREALADLPLAALAPSQQLMEMFSLWGLHRCGDVAELHEIDFIARVGQAGKRLLLLARGEFPHLMVPEEQVFALEEQVTFESPVEILDTLLFVLGPMLDQLILRAGARALALASVTVRLKLDGMAGQDSADAAAEPSEHVSTVKPALPLMDRGVLLKLLHLHLQAHAPSAAVLGIHLSAEPGDRSKVQLGLFSPQLPEPTRLDVTLARIAALVGEERVGCARLLDMHRPDSFVMERFSSFKAQPTRLPGRLSCSIALRRMRPPLNLPMRLQDGLPTEFLFEGDQFEVKETYGPWRQSGDWWSSLVWSREEWDVCAVARGGTEIMCIVVRDLLRNVWQLEAIYD